MTYSYQTYLTGLDSEKEKSPSDKATCSLCQKKIAKGSLRIRVKSRGYQRVFSRNFHLDCYIREVQEFLYYLKDGKIC